MEKTRRKEVMFRIC